MALTADCPNCKIPGQHVGMACGFCSHMVPMSGTDVAPDGSARVEEVIGFRAWRVATTENGPRLKSPLFDLTWEPHEWMTAYCGSGGHENHVDGCNPHNGHGPGASDPALWSPVKNCGGEYGHGCGFYAGRTREHLIKLGYGNYTTHSPSVIGQVQMAGKIIPATNGWRAQKCRARHIYVPHEFWELARDLRAVYGSDDCTVELGATLVLPKSGAAGAIEWCAKCKAKMGRNPTCPFCGHTHQ